MGFGLCRNKWFYLFFLIFYYPLIYASESIVLVLENGDKIQGKYLGTDEQGNIHFRSELLGDITAPADKAQLVKAAAASPPPPPPQSAKPAIRQWLHIPESLKVSLSAGYASSRGNTIYKQRTAAIGFDWITPAHQISSLNQIKKADANDQSISDEKRSDNLWQYNFNDRVYSLFGARYYQDDIQKIDSQAEFFLAPGMYLLKNKKCQVSLAAGADFIWEDLAAVSPVGPDPESDKSLRGALYEALDCTPTQNLMVKQSVVYTRDVKESTDYRYRFILAVSAALLDGFTLSVSYNVGYNNVAQAGIKKKQTDMTTMLNYRF